MAENSAALNEMNKICKKKGKMQHKIMSQGFPTGIKWGSFSKLTQE